MLHWRMEQRRLAALSGNALTTRQTGRVDATEGQKPQRSGYIIMIRVFICLILTLGSICNATAAVYINEGWEDAPGSCWPCKSPGCVEQYNGWDAYDPVEQGGEGAETVSGISTAQSHSGSKSLLMAKMIDATGGCNIQYNFSEPYPTTIYVRFYVYFTSDWEAFGPSPGTVHWIFTNSYQSSTGFRLNLQTNDFWSDCPVGGACMLPQGTGGNNEWYFPLKVDPDWTAGTNFKTRLNEWICLEYKMEISGTNVILTEWVDGVQTRGPSTGPGQEGSDFRWIALLDYENAGSSSQLRYYIDDFVVSDTYIGPTGSTPARKLNNVTGVRVTLH